MDEGLESQAEEFWLYSAWATGEETLSRGAEERHSAETEFLTRGGVHFQAEQNQSVSTLVVWFKQDISERPTVKTLLY